MSKSWIGRKRAGANRLARVLSCVFGVSFTACVALVTVALWASSPANAEKEKSKTGAGFKGPDYILDVSVGGAFLEMPRISAGTVLVGGLEIGLSTSVRYVVGPSVTVGGTFEPGTNGWRFAKDDDDPYITDSGIRLSHLTRKPRVSWAATYANLRGNTNGMEPVNGRNVAFTYLEPNPATGTTGVTAGATGQTAKIKSGVHQVDFHLDYTQPLFGGPIDDTGGWVLTGSLGGQYTFNWGMQTIDTRSLTFPGVSSKTELMNDDHFFGPRIGMGLAVQDGPFYVSLDGFFSPGYYISKGFAMQHNLCDVCVNPADRDFQLKHNVTKRGFGLRAGVNFNAGVFLTDNIQLGIGANYIFNSRVGSFKNPITPTEQPVRYGTESAHGFRISAQLKFSF